MEAFLCIFLTLLLFARLYKKTNPVPKPQRPQELVVDEQTISSFGVSRGDTVARKPKEAIDKRREEEARELRKQGYSEDLIAIILPTIINDGQ